MSSSETDCIIDKGRKQHVQPLSTLREINRGAWDGQLIEEIRKMFPDECEKQGSDSACYRPLA
ncbi:MAG: histidine phosphatase family protein [Geobacteraceae bacterium]|nr:histidine phosphatase family protein [Geobacteraceae bacterium]